MALPMVDHRECPAANCEANSQLPQWMKHEQLTGTTIMAVEFDGGVVIGADSRTTTGAYIANRVTDKLTKIHDRIYCCRSGSAADTQAVADIVSYQLEFYSVQTGEPPEVKVAANLFREMCYDYRDQLSAGIIIGGWDKKHGGKVHFITSMDDKIRWWIYIEGVYSIPLGGMITHQPVAIGGSGSTYMYAYVDKTFKEGMTKEECMKFVSDGIALAMVRDGSSGGIVRLACITEDGVERKTILGNELPRFYEG